MASRTPGSKDREYRGTHDHNDHLHIELSVEGGRMETPWFNGPMEPPTSEPCALIGPAGAVIDDSDPCFTAYGPAEYWRRVSGQGLEGTFLRRRTA